MTAPSEPQITWGFWLGMIIGLVAGVFVGGFAMIGQGVWDEGRDWGYLQCQMEQRIAK